MTSTLRSRLLRLFAAVIFCSLLLSLQGCVVLGAFAAKAAPAPKTPAQYVPAQESLVVVVEGYQNPGIVGFLGGHMERMISEQLITHDVAPIINPNLLNDFRNGRTGDEYRQVKIASIGKALKAKQVLYVNVTQFSLESAGGTQMAKGLAEARVRIVDVATGETRWPRDASGGQVLQLNTPYVELTGGVTESALRDRMARGLCDKVARLFYAATTEQVDGSEPETGNLAQ